MIDGGRLYIKRGGKRWEDMEERIEDIMEREEKVGAGKDGKRGVATVKPPKGHSGKVSQASFILDTRGVPYREVHFIR